MEELQFGQFGLSAVLMAVVGIVYKMAGDALSERWKVLIMILIGVGLGVLAIPYQGLPWTVVNIVNCLLAGLMSAAAASGFYSWQSKGLAKSEPRKIGLIPVLLLLAWIPASAGMTGCATIGATGPDAAAARGVAWYEDIQNWTPHQKANFVMETWSAEHAAYKQMNAISGKSAELVKLLEVKREVLEASRIPVRMYVSLVRSGGTPDADIEQQIIAWLRQLQIQALQGGK